MTKQQWAFSVLPFSVTQEFSVQQGLKYELSLRLIQKHSLPLLFARDYHTHMSFTVASAVHCIQNQTAQVQVWPVFTFLLLYRVWIIVKEVVVNNRDW